MKQQTSKNVQIIARVEFKDDLRKVIYLVRSSDGETQYETHLFAGKAMSCTCPAKKPCYHMKRLELREKERTACKENEVYLAKIERETLAQLEEEQPVAPAELSEQARIAYLDDTVEVKVEQWTSEELARQQADQAFFMGQARKVDAERARRASMGKRSGLLMPAPLTQTPTTLNLDMSHFMRA